jgi:hypothetical protein
MEYYVEKQMLNDITKELQLKFYSNVFFSNDNNILFNSVFCTINVNINKYPYYLDTGDIFDNPDKVINTYVNHVKYMYQCIKDTEQSIQNINKLYLKLSDEVIPFNQKISTNLKLKYQNDINNINDRNKKELMRCNFYSMFDFDSPYYEGKKEFAVKLEADSFNFRFKFLPKTLMCYYKYYVAYKISKLYRNWKLKQAKILISDWVIWLKYHPDGWFCKKTAPEWNKMNSKFF